MAVDNLDFEKFKEYANSGRAVKLWHVTDKEGYRGLCTLGFDREYIGKNSKVYGDGVYTTYTLKSTLENRKGGTYGGIILECVLLDGLKDFIFFDKRMNEKYNNNESLIDQFKKLLPKSLYDKVVNSPRLNDVIHYPNFMSDSPLHGKMYRTAPMVMNFVDIVAPRINGNASNRFEGMLAKTKIRGYVFNGYNDGEVVVVRDFKSLIPVRSSVDGVNWKNILTKEEFDNITNSYDAGYSLIGKYPNMNPNEKMVCGMIKIKNQEGKYNYYDKNNECELLPVWVDKAFPFDSTSKTGLFVHDGKKYKVGKDYIVDIEMNEKFPISDLVGYLNNDMAKSAENKNEPEMMGGFDDLFEQICREALMENEIGEIAELSWDDFKRKFDSEKIGDRDWKNINKDRFVHLWHCTKASNLKDITNIGFDVAYRGGEALGKGAYTSFSLDSARGNKSTYGGSIIECVLNGGLNDFLFFDREMNNIYNGGKSLDEQYRELMPKEIYEYLRSHHNDYPSILHFSSNACQTFLSMMSAYGRKFQNGTKNYYSNPDYAEFALAKTKVKGWVVDYWCGKSVIVRNYKDLIPVAFSKDGYHFSEILTKDSYESIGSQEDIGLRFRDKYPMTNDNEKIQCGFLRVRGSNGKYNYVNVRTMEELLPKGKWAETAHPFDELSHSAIFIVNGIKYKTNGTLFFDFKTNEPVSADELGSEKEESTGEMMGGFDDLFERMERIRVDNANHSRIII